MKAVKLAKKQEAQALRVYTDKFNANLYNAAIGRNVQKVVYKVSINEDGSKYGNALINEALALCGSPSYKLSNRNWGKEASAFLSAFSL